MTTEVRESVDGALQALRLRTERDSHQRELHAVRDTSVFQKRDLRIPVDLIDTVGQKLLVRCRRILGAVPVRRPVPDVAEEDERGWRFLGLRPNSESAVDHRGRDRYRSEDRDQNRPSSAFSCGSSLKAAANAPSGAVSMDRMTAVFVSTAAIQ